MRSGGVTSFDSSALAYFTAGSITNATEKSAVNTLIVGLKADGTWTRLVRFYLCSPTSSTAALLDCVNLTSMTNVGASYSIFGWDMGFKNTQYLDTNYILASPITQTNMSFGMRFYQGSVLDDAEGYLMGGFSEESTANIAMSLSAVAGLAQYDAFGSSANGEAQVTGLSTSLIASRYFTRTAAATLGLYFDGVNVTETSNSGTGTMPTTKFYFGLVNNKGNPIAISGGLDDMKMVDGFIGQGLTSAQILSMNTRLVAYQTALGRG